MIRTQIYTSVASVKKIINKYSIVHISTQKPKLNNSICQNSSVIFYSFFCPCRCRINLVLAIFFTFLIIVAAFTRQHFIKHSLKVFTLENILDWNRQVNEYSSSKFNLTTHTVHGESYGYVVAESLCGQQGAGIQALMSLQCWAASFSLPIRILEPLLSNTTFVSIASAKHPKSTFLRFSDLFDIQYFNRISASLGYAVLGTREDFFTAAPRDVIFVEMKKVEKNTSMDQRIPQVVWTADSKQNGDHNCYQFRGMHAQMEQLTKEHFCIIRIIKAAQSVQNSYIFSDKDLRKVIYGNKHPQHVTLIFSLWKTPWYVSNNELEDPYWCKHTGIGSKKEQFIPSPRLMADVTYYEERFLDSSNEVAVMLRLEHMTEFLKEQHSAKKWTIDRCLNEVFRVTREKQTSGYPMVTLDVGRFGSAAMNFLHRKEMPKLMEKSIQLLTSLFDNKRTFEEWEESFTKATGTEHSGYIAALQRTLASRTKCLILVGGGTFQDLALKDYIKYHPNKADRCVELICVKKPDAFKNIIDKF